MSETEVAGQKYRIGKLDAMKQFHVARRLAPLLTELIKTDDGATESEKNGDRMIRIVSRLAPVMSQLPDEVAEYVIYTCLGVVQRQQGPNWAPVTARGQNRLMFEDLDMQSMLELTIAVINENLANFFSGSQPSSTESKVP